MKGKAVAVDYVLLCKILAIGLLFHVVAIMSIFDIHFRSPISHGQTPLSNIAGPAKRVVFIVADGLRADKCFAEGRAPFLSKTAAESGAFGVSHTRVPTESRPGHVAMLAGLYEDPSAVTKGWQENPVDFDHLLRRANYAVAVGAPEIVSMFPGERIARLSYGEEMVDFGLGSKVLEQDKWPIDRIIEMFGRAKDDIGLNDALRQDKVFLLIHLLGHDTNGHAYGPQSTEYAENTGYVDKRVEELVGVLNEFYSDGRTAFVFTADHGMNDARGHGDGDPDCTRTPLIVWGAGVAGPLSDPDRSSHRRDLTENYSLGWGRLSRLRRRDIAQADLTPLVASLLGMAVPVNSEGKLPCEYLSDDKYRQRALLRNLKQHLENYRVKEVERERKHQSFVPFIKFKLSYDRASVELGKLLKPSQEDFDYKRAYQLMDDILAGIDYLNKYDRWLLFGLVTAGYLGWIGFGVLAVVKLYSAYGSFYVEHTALLDRSSLTSVMFMCATCAALVGRSAPASYFLYAFFPAWFLRKMLQSRDLFKVVYAQSHNIFDRQAVYGLVRFVVMAELLVVSYYDRRVLSLVVASIDTNMPVLSGLLAVFTMLPAIKDHDYLLMATGVLASSGVLFRERAYTQLLVQLVAASCVAVADRSLRAKAGLPLPVQIVGWGVMASSAATLLLSGRQSPRRLTVIFGSLLPVLTLLSVSHEVAFLTCFFLHTHAWLEFCSRKSTSSAKASRDKPRWLRLSDISLATDLIAYLHVAFFGLGNIASLASFSLPSVYRLLTRFRPFAMASLLILKTILPMLLLACVFARLQRKLELPPFSVLLLAAAGVDLVTVHFLFLARSKGSWLDIGLGISRFVLANAFIVVGLLVAGSGYLLTL